MYQQSTEAECGGDVELLALIDQETNDGESGSPDFQGFDVEPLNELSPGNTQELQICRPVEISNGR